MSNIITLRQTLVENAGILASEAFVYTRLDTIIARALLQHNKTYSISSLPESEEECVVVLAWASVCYIRASKFANEANASGGGFTADRDTPYKKNIDLANDLIARYQLLVAALGITDSGSTRIAVGTILKRDPLHDSLIPLIVAPNTGRIDAVLTVLSPNTSVQLDWAVTNWDGGYFDLIFFQITGSTSLIAPWNVANPDSGIRGLLNGATRLVTINDPEVTEIRFEDLDRTQINRFLLIAKNNSGKYAFSNELVLAAA